MTSEAFVGIDLAWGPRAQSGVAVVDQSGRLVSSSSFHSDEELAEWLATHAGDARVVAIDAPLIVPNATGQRAPERLIGQAYGRYGASAHTSNRGNPHFNPPRAASLAEALGWRVDPESAPDGGSLCIEVYPHPALVGLFELPQRVLYKKGPAETRLRGFLQLARLLESVDVLRLDESPRWTELRTVIAQPRPGDLNRIEDEIDAILCAHLAWLWVHQPSALTVYGSVSEGYIVAPPPPTHAPNLVASRTRRKDSSSARSAPRERVRGSEDTGLISIARALAIGAHIGIGQTDKAGAPYWCHPERVAGHVRRLYPNAPDAAVAAAWLHDIVEDTQWTLDDLRGHSVSDDAVHAVDLLTHTDDNDGDEYYVRIRDDAGIALMVKHADITDNTDPARLALLEPELASRLREKYAHALAVLGLRQ